MLKMCTFLVLDFITDMGKRKKTGPDTPTQRQIKTEHTLKDRQTVPITNLRGEI